MTLDPMAVGIVIFLSCLGGALFLFLRAIRCFITRNYWSAFMSLLIALLLSHIIGCGMFPPPPSGMREKARRATCMNNLKQFGLFLKFYANDHDGKYPVTFNDLVGGYIKNGDQMIFVCPSSGHKAGGLTNIHAWTDYAYVTGLTEADPSNCVVMLCPPSNHKDDGGIVAFRGGLVQWLSCKSEGKTSPGQPPTFQELTNTPSLFYGTTNEAQLADLKKRTRIIYPHAGGQ